MNSATILAALVIDPVEAKSSTGFFREKISGIVPRLVDATSNSVQDG